MTRPGRTSLSQALLRLGPHRGQAIALPRAVDAAVEPSCSPSRASSAPLYEEDEVKGINPSRNFIQGLYYEIRDSYEWYMLDCGLVSRKRKDIFAKIA